MLKTCLIALFTILNVQPSIDGHQSSKPHTVLDYYLLLPDKYFEADREQRVKWMLDQKHGAIVDVRNGYIYARGDGAQTSIYVCLFKKTDGSYLIAVKSHDPDTDEYTHLDFYVYENWRLIDVSKAALPVAVSEELRYAMPRYGTTIKVSNKRGRKMYDLVWVRNRFKLKRH